MADKTTENNSAPVKISKKAMLIVAAIMVVEAVVVAGVLMLGGPQRTEASTAVRDLALDDPDQTREIEVISDRFQNFSTGRTWFWEISVYLQVKNRHRERVERILSQRSVEISEGISQIVSRAQHVQLTEPERQTLNRQITAYLETILHTDADGRLFERLLLPRCRGFMSN